MGIMDECLNRNNNQAMIASFESQNVDFTENNVGLGLRMSEIASIATVPFNTQWEPAYDPMPVGQDQVGTIISSVSNTLDPCSFYDALKLDVAKSELKMSIGATIAFNGNGSS